MATASNTNLDPQVPYAGVPAVGPNSKPSLAEQAAEKTKTCVERASEALKQYVSPRVTCLDFNWTLKASDKSWGSLITENDLVTTLWSEEFFIGSKQNVGLFKDSFINIFKDLGSCAKNAVTLHPVRALRNFRDVIVGILNTVLLGAEQGISIEVLNFVKGIAGFLISICKAPCHLLRGILYRGLFQTLGFLAMGDLIKAKKAFGQCVDDMVAFVKDIVQAITCVGHAIPSWLAPLIFMTVPHVAIPLLVLGILRVGTQYAGLSDLVGYGGTLALLWIKTKTGSETEREEAQKKFNHLKKELNPLISMEGAMLTAFGIHVFASFVETLLEVTGVMPVVNGLLEPILKYTMNKAADIIVPGAVLVLNLAYLGIQHLRGKGQVTPAQNLREPLLTATQEQSA